MVLFWAANLLAAPPLKREKAKPFTAVALEGLIHALEARGHSRETLGKVFTPKRVRREPMAIFLNGISQESKPSYDKFLVEESWQQMRKFMRRHRKILNRARKRYGVPPDVLLAIFLVETRFGKAKLRYKVLDVYTTLAIDSHPEALKGYYRQIRKRHRVDFKRFQARMHRKGAWAHDQLEALLETAESHQLDIFRLKGSYAGAFGMPQFIPSSFQDHAVDGNQDGKIDLDQTSDAIMSAAAYLAAHGWTPKASLGKKFRAIWAYNNSDPYVRTIFSLKLAMALPGKKSVAKKTASKAQKNRT